MQDGTPPPPGHPRETDAARGDAYARDCPTRQLLDRVGDKWSVLVLQLLGAAPRRFSALKREIGGISQKMLSQTLRSLERDGLVTRHVEPSVPVKVSYAITPLGGELVGALALMIDWAERRMTTVLAAQRRYDTSAG
ncbi:winged helix-turn-helix transcriptional regulator [Sphingomonas adhaesiva]|uniref:winged helix-turn-helix transcriptional regulator n=1 Tax=Sphingomonas adhaesiva TaxID=28212 RepID=UPI002FFA0495